MIRIRKTRWKVIYIVCGFLLAGFNPLALAPMLPPFVAAVSQAVLLMLLWLGGVRSFRGPGEPIKPPRAWWRMTSRPRAGFVVGSQHVLFFVNNILIAVFGPSNFTLACALGALIYGPLAFLFFRSSIRLRRFPPETVPEPVELPRWKPVIR